jgi:hypothetical protein
VIACELQQSRKERKCVVALLRRNRNGIGEQRRSEVTHGIAIIIIISKENNAITNHNKTRFHKTGGAPKTKSSIIEIPQIFGT